LLHAAGCSSSGGGAVVDGGNDAADAGSEAGGDAAVATPIITRPNPIISRSVAAAQVFSSPAGGAAVRDGTYHNGGWNAGVPTEAAPSWVAMKLTPGPTRVLVVWDDGGTYNYQDPTTATVYGFPAAYHIDVSADSTNGSDGSWTPVATVTANLVRTRGHSFDFTGMSWIKMVITAAPANESGNGVQIGEIDVHDISATGTALPDDTWFFMGDSITAFAFDRASQGSVHQPSFAAGINAAVPAFFPAMINGGIGGEKTTDGLARLPAALTLNPDYRFFVLGYGTNDAASGPSFMATFQANLQSMIDMVKAAGRLPIIPHIPYSGDGGHPAIPDYNAVIDAVTQSNQLIAGPDLYGYLLAHPEEFICAVPPDAPTCGGGRATDLLHPNDAGLRSINRLWTQKELPLYLQP
jgi:lysophospholipase L1-like esterase